MAPHVASSRALNNRARKRGALSESRVAKVGSLPGRARGATEGLTEGWHNVLGRKRSSPQGTAVDRTWTLRCDRPPRRGSRPVRTMRARPTRQAREDANAHCLTRRARTPREHPPATERAARGTKRLLSLIHPSRVVQLSPCVANRRVAGSSPARGPAQYAMCPPKRALSCPTLGAAARRRCRVGTPRERRCWRPSDEPHGRHPRGRSGGSCWIARVPVHSASRRPSAARPSCLRAELRHAVQAAWRLRVRGGS